MRVKSTIEIVIDIIELFYLLKCALYNTIIFLISRKYFLIHF